MGHVLATSLQLKDSMDTILSLSAKKELSEREKLYIEAIKHMSARYCFSYNCIKLFKSYTVQVLTACKES